MNALILMILKSEKELEIERERQALRKPNDRMAVPQLPQPKKKDREKASVQIRSSHPCSCDH
jgi:hypothetical protein